MFTSEEFAIMHINDLERHKFVLTSDGKIAIRVLGGAGGDMLKTENLAGLTDLAIARSNLEVYSSDDIDTLLTGYALTGHNHTGVYEPVFSKNTGFNKNFGTAAGTVLEGNRDALYEKLANKGQANGYAPLDSGSLIPSMYLPSYVDDVIDAALYASLPVTGEAGKIYNVYGDTIALNGSYRWGGAAYSKISSVSDAVWGHITGTLTDQADLVSALAGKAALSHTHVLADLPNISQNHFLGRNSAGSGAIEVLSATQTRSALSVYSISDIDGFTVKLTGDQTITGVKTFSSAPVVPDASFSIAKTTGLQTVLDGKASLTSNTFSGNQNFTNSTIWAYLASGEALLSLGNGSAVSGYRRAFIYHDLTNLVIANQENGSFGVNTNNLRRLTILGDGNIGIGITTPSEKLDIAGNIRIREFIKGTDTGAGVMKISGTGVADDKIYLQFWNAALNSSASEVNITGQYGNNIPWIFIEANNFVVDGQNWTSSWSTYTPTAFMSSGSGASFTIYAARIKQIGKNLFIHLDIGVAGKGTASGDFGIINPFGAVSTFMSGGIYRGATQVGLLPQINGTSIKVVKTAGSGVVQWSDINNGDLIYMSGCIEVA